MKRLWLSIGILIFLLAATMANTWAIERITGQLSDLLLQAEALADSGDWSQAESLTRQALERWNSSTDYLYTVLRHADTDAVNTGLQEVLELICCQEPGEYASSNARLLAQIHLLAEMERLNLKNLL